MSLTEEERDVVMTLVMAYKRFLDLPQYHPSDQREFVGHLHAMQNIVMSRIAVRTDSDIFVCMVNPESPLVKLPESPLQRLAKADSSFPPLQELHDTAMKMWKIHCQRDEHGKCSECGGSGTWPYTPGVILPRPWHERKCSMNRETLEWLDFVRWCHEQEKSP